MKSKISHTAKGLLFFLIFLILLSGSSQIMRPKDNTEAQWKHDLRANGILGEPENTVDVVFFGDSEVYSSIIPLRIWEKYGYTSYDCSSSGQNLWFTMQLMVDVFDRQHPKIVVLETNAIFRYFNMDNLLLHGAELFFPILKYHDRWKNMTFQDVMSPVDYTYRQPDKGYLFTKDINPASEKGYMTPSDGYANIAMVNRFYVQMLANYCRHHGAKLILMSTPSTRNWRMSKHNSIARLAQNLGVEYVDMNLLREEIPIDWSHDTRDYGDHMNIYGAEKVTTYIGQYLAETGLLTSHKEDPSFKSWTDALNTFKKKYKRYLTFIYGKK